MNNPWSWGLSIGRGGGPIFYIGCYMEIVKKKVISRTRNGNVPVVVFGMTYPCKMGIQSLTNEDPEIYGVKGLENKNLSKTEIGKMFLKNPNIFLRTSYGNTFVNGINHHYDIQIQTCTHEGSMFCGVQGLKLHSDT